MAISPHHPALFFGNISTSRHICYVRYPGRTSWLETLDSGGREEALSTPHALGCCLCLLELSPTPTTVRFYEWLRDKAP